MNLDVELNDFDGGDDYDYDGDIGFDERMLHAINLL